MLGNNIHNAIKRLCGGFGCAAIGANWRRGEGPGLTVTSPINGGVLIWSHDVSVGQAREAIDVAAEAFLKWRDTPAPVRGELVRRIGNAFRKHHDDLATLVMWEVGKIWAEARGEVQEVIDICDFAVGLSRQLYGNTITSERTGHRLAEYWHPLGPVGVISAFNFPVAVWAWNAMIGLVCGDPILWKPSEKTPLSAIACQQIVQDVIADTPDTPDGISSVLIGDAEIGKALTESPKLPLISATGSIPMGRAVAKTVAGRLGRTLLELGGNNGMIVSPTADLELAIRSIVFAAVGTCGQRCTTLRRLIVHESIADKLRDRILAIYENLSIGEPTQEGVLVGPLIDENAFNAMQQALIAAREQGDKVHGGDRLKFGPPYPRAYYVRPALVEIGPEAPIIQQETFAPILYFMRYCDFEDAIRIHNAVPQGLSSAILTNDMREAERFTSPAGSDCGIVNVNVGTSGAEIGGAFGGEKETGGGRESGSDSWKAYMRRVTSTVNYSDALPLAQGIKFDV
jgi:aldehyde dehydrogenase (NAD+)